MEINGRAKRNIIDKNGTMAMQRINDILAIVYVCVILAFSKNQSIAWPVQIIFFCVTFINAYLKGKKLNILCLWAIAFYGFCIMSVIWAYKPEGVYSIITSIARYTLLIVMVSLYADKEREINIVLKSFIFGSIIILMNLVINTPLDQWGVERVGADISFNQNFLGLICVYSATMCLYYARKTNLYFIGFIVIAFFSLFTGSRKAFVVLLMVIIMYYIHKLNKPSNILYIIPLGALFLFIVYLVMNNPALYNVLGRRMEGLLNMIGGEGKVDQSTLVRMDLISTGFKAFQKKPIIGYGINNFQYLSKYDFYAHNNYIELLTDVGLIGTVLYYISPIIICIKAIMAYLSGNRDVFLCILFPMTIFVMDYGMVSYSSQISLLLITVSYCMLANGGLSKKT